MSLTIENLSRHTHLVPRLARWHQQEWRALGRETTLQQRMHSLHGHIAGDDLPSSWVALRNRVPAGSVSLVRYSPLAASDGCAWMTNLYVAPCFRGAGIGRALVDRAIAGGRALQLNYLYLFTIDHRDYYRSLHWQWCRKVRVQGSWSDIMRFDVSHGELQASAVAANAQSSCAGNADDVVANLPCG